MKNFVLIMIAMALSSKSWAMSPDNVKYYAGTSILSVASTGAQSPSQRILVKRVVSEATSRIVEIASIGGAGGKCRQSPAYMVINGNHVLVADNPNMQSGLLEGTGFVSGTPWSWEYLVLDMKTKFGGHISWVHDINIVSENEIHAVKSIYSNVGTNEEPIKSSEPVSLMTVEVAKIDQAQYLKEIAALGCDPN